MSRADLPEVIVIGAGGVGVIAALSLSLAGESRVSLVVRSDYEQVREHGYEINSCDYGQLRNWRPHRFFKGVEEASESGKFFEYVVVTTKNIPDGPEGSTVPDVIRPIVESNRRLCPERQTNILLIQNGIDIEKDIYAKFDCANEKIVVLSGTQLIGSTKIGKGVIRQIGQDHILVGPFDVQNKAAVDAAQKFIDLYRCEDRNLVLFDDKVRYTRWRKLIYNSVISTTTALVGMDVSRCLKFGVAGMGTEEEIFKPGMREIFAIAASEGIELDEECISFFCDISRKQEYKPSMCIDCENGQLMELEVLLGNPLKIARENGVETPVLSLLYNMLYMVQNKLKEQKGYIKFELDDE
ncbi:hypothetical protein HG536_0B04970 [Torulaspora globosa]|uniref:2-dehydropantoate 2-reductase n=1 Tax=Torulaspora globosa TaxID=48254 RepID=A0A7G3ZDP7_9SACH|nr:uncharacterized protein HG536_0B04970 [Torulaspora globosa]QLL31633.1 hypothetical protein HG536_0B04970 [Torulaspora globosa]